MQLADGYKQTEVGVIPADWQVLPVGQMGDVRAGKALAANGPGAQRPYLRTMNVFDGQIVLEDVLWMPMTDAEFSVYKLEYGDVLLNEGQSLELVGRCAMYRVEYGAPCAIQNALVRFRANKGVSSEFATHLFRQCQKTGVFARVALQTTSVAHLGVSRFQKLKLAWPLAEEEQRAIAEALSDVDALINALDALITKKRQIKQGTMQQLLTGKKRLPGFGGDWVEKTLGAMGATYGGLTGKTKADFGEGEAKYVTFMNVMTNVVIDCQTFDNVRVSSSESQNRVSNGDLLFNGSSETPEEVAMCSLVSEDVADLYLNSFCFGFRFHPQVDADGLFMSYYLRGKEGRELMKSLAQGSTRYNLSKRAFLESSVRVPSVKEQTAIAEVLSDMDAEINALEQKRDKTKLIKQGMMQELLTGKTRLI